MTELAFVGAGAMGGSIIRRLLDLGTDPTSMLVVDLSPEARATFDAAGVATSDDIRDVAGSEVVVIAVKPQHWAEALTPLSGVLDDELLISVVAGKPTRAYEQLLGPVAVIRCMPNTPALIGQGMTALAPGTHATEDHLARAESILAAVGATVVVEEPDLDAVTAVSGSGPAYLFLLAESMIEAALGEGLSPEVARRLVEQTLLGSAALLHASEDGPDVLRVRVTSPGGTTQAALEVFEESGFREMVSRAIAAAAARSRELGREG